MVSSCQIGQWNLSHSCGDFRYEMPGCWPGGGCCKLQARSQASPAPFAPFDSHPPRLRSGRINSQLPDIRTLSALLAFLLPFSLCSFNGYLMGTDIR